jgi:Cu(I)/Ag(I) efflux system membrane fusion protein
MSDPRRHGDAPVASPLARMERRGAWTAAVVVTVVALGAGTYALGRQGSDARPAAAPQAADGMAGMAGMPGMSSGGDGTVRLTADQIRQFGITFGTVEERTLETAVRTAGVVTIDERRITTVAPRFGGFVERLLVETTGERVSRGQALAEVYSPEVVAAEEELLVARRLGSAMGSSEVSGLTLPTSDLVDAARRRLLLLGVSASEIDAVLRSGRARRTVTVRAPAGGVVLEKRVTQGQAIAAGEPLYTIADLGAVWIDAELREADAANVREGSAAEVELASSPGVALEGTVTSIYPTLDAATRTIRARIAVANSDGRLRPGMYATVRMTTPTRPALTVPVTAVINTGERSIVFVDMGGGELMPHDVRIGRISGDHAEVLSGVDAGHRVVTSAQYLLESESNLAEVMRAMMGQMGSGGSVAGGAGGAAHDMSGMKGMDGMPGMESTGADTRGLPPAASRTPAPRP